MQLNEDGNAEELLVPDHDAMVTRVERLEVMRKGKGARKHVVGVPQQSRVCRLRG